MKSCPICKRIYEDDTLVFCLEDGTRLSAGNIPRSTSARDLDPDRTAILPAGLGATQQSPLPPRPTIPSPPPTAYTQGGSRIQPLDKRSGTAWIILSGIFALVVIGLIIVAGIFVWNGNKRRVPEFSRAGPARTPNNASPVTNPTIESRPADIASGDWLNGVWEGEGYQTDTKTTWAVRLTVRDHSYSIDYPDIPCQGRWDLIDKNSRAATFTEVITKGADRCGNNSHVMIEKTSAFEISCRYTHPRSRVVIASVVLSKKE